MLLDARWASPLAGDDAGYHRGRPPRNKGEEYPADPPTVEEIIGLDLVLEGLDKLRHA